MLCGKVTLTVDKLGGYIIVKAKLQLDAEPQLFHVKRYLVVNSCMQLLDVSHVK